MAKAVADVDDPDEKQGGFATGNASITGFSHMHDSGTGGVSGLQKFLYYSHRQTHTETGGSPRHWVISPSFPRPAALGTPWTTANSPKRTELLGESMGLLKRTLDTLP